MPADGRQLGIEVEHYDVRLREAFPLVAAQLAADEVPATIHGKPLRVVLLDNDAPANVRLERDGRTWAWVEATGPSPHHLV